MWEQIRANRRKSVFILLIMFLLLVIIGYAAGEAIHHGAGLIGVAGATIIFFFQLVAYMWAAESILLSGMGARELTFDESPRLFNIVEEMKLASGLQHMPRIYLIDEAAPNAFAIGRKPENSAIAVTAGLMHRLNRDELQGVIAHEVGHLNNRDVQFMTLAGVLIGSIVIVSDLTMRALRNGSGRSSSRSSSRGNSGGGHPIFFIIAIALIILGPILARMLYFAASRSREYLADACAAQYTRYPEGLASALMRISRAGILMPQVNQAVAPMFIVNPLALESESTSMFATHPPTLERVKVLRGMGGGASFADYEASFKAATGKGVIGQKTLSAAAPVPAREATNEEPIESKQEVRATVHRMYGYVSVDCQCGANLRVPTSFEDDKVVCIRCGAKNPLPAAKERYADILEKTAPKQDMSKAPPLQFARAGGGWQSFRCACGGTVQLSPNFSGSRVFCSKCRRKIEITGEAA